MAKVLEGKDKFGQSPSKEKTLGEKGGEVIAFPDKEGHKKKSEGSPKFLYEMFADFIEKKFDEFIAIRKEQDRIQEEVHITTDQNRLDNIAQEYGDLNDQWNDIARDLFREAGEYAELFQKIQSDSDAKFPEETNKLNDILAALRNFTNPLNVENRAMLKKEEVFGMATNLLNALKTPPHTKSN